MVCKKKLLAAVLQCLWAQLCASDVSFLGNKVTLSV